MNEKDTDDYKVPTIEEMKKEYQLLLESLPQKLPFRQPSYQDKKIFPMWIQHVKTGLKYRTVNLTNTAIKLFEDNEFLSAMIITRSVLETSCMLFWLQHRIENALKTSDLKDIDTFLLRMGFGNKIENKKIDELDFDALNVLTAIDKLSKSHKTPHLRELYGHLCEFAHPNYDGTFGLFALINNKDNCMDFAFDAFYHKHDKPQEYGINLLSMSIIIFNMSEEKIDELMPDFEKLCNTEEIQGFRHAL